MQDFLMVFYVLFYATGFMGGAALILLDMRVRSRLLKHLLLFQLLFLLGLGVLLTYFYLQNQRVPPPDPGWHNRSDPQSKHCGAFDRPLRCDSHHHPFHENGDRPVGSHGGFSDTLRHSSPPGVPVFPMLLMTAVFLTTLLTISDIIKSSIITMIAE
jgi:hypothetical protein